jgi:KipI family sensor histidine kinase inhibitor
MDVRLSRFGPRGILVQFADRLDETSLARCRGLTRWFSENPPAGLTDVIPACEALLLEFANEAAAKGALHTLESALRDVRPLPAEHAPLHTLPVQYDGPDLEELARRKGMTADEVVSIHTATTYSVYVIGFSPGFPYLGPLDPLLHLPRRATPRVRVPTGSVAIGGEHTGVYSISSPGGWWLIGQTAVELFSRKKAEGAGETGAFLLQPGDRVKFAPIAA